MSMDMHNEGNLPQGDSDGQYLAPRNSFPVKTRITTFREVCASIPMSDMGLPKFLYRCDLVPEDLFDMPVHEQAGLLGEASQEIHYREGFPAFSNGSAIWSQMEYEPDEGYLAFKQYLKLSEEFGIRRLEQLVENYSLGGDGSEIPGSSISILDQRSLVEFHTYYHWSSRSKAFDLFQLAAHQKLREKRILSTTNQHFLRAERILGQLLPYFEKIDDDGTPVFMKDMTAKTAVEIYEKLAKLQRISIGLPAHGLSDADKNSTAPSSSVEVTLRQIARQGEDPSIAGQSTSAAESLDMLLNNPDTAAAAQELIISVNTDNQGDT